MEAYQKKFLLMCFFCGTCFGQRALHNDSEEDALRLVFPVFSLGQSVVGKNRLLTGLLVNAPYWSSQKCVFCTPAVLYGVSDTLSVQGFMPITARNQSGDKLSHGLGDLIAGFEWAYYLNESSESFTQATIFNQYKIPVSSRVPDLTSGAVDILIGGTISHDTRTFYTFASTGLLIPTWHNNMRKGYNFFYEFGIGPIITQKHSTLFSVFLEIDGIFTTADTNNPYPVDATLRNNVVFAGPVFYCSYKNIIAQFGVQAPLTQSYEQMCDKRNVRIGSSLYYVF